MTNQDTVHITKREFERWCLFYRHGAIVIPIDNEFGFDCYMTWFFDTVIMILHTDAEGSISHFLVKVIGNRSSPQQLTRILEFACDFIYGDRSHETHLFADWFSILRTSWPKKGQLIHSSSMLSA